MRFFLTILVAALAAFGARGLAGERTGRAEAASEPAPEIAALQVELSALRAANERLGRELERREKALIMARSPAAPDELDDQRLGAALARWHAAHPAEARAVAEHKSAAATRITQGEIDLAAVPMAEIVQALADGGLTQSNAQVLFQELRDSGRMDEYLAAIEKLAAEDPENADLQVALGNAYLQKLFGVGHAPEAGPLAFKSDAAFDRALEIDEHNWNARFTKAVSLSNWPAFLGRGPEAIEQFEILLGQQAQEPVRPEFAMTYLFLGNMYQTSGNREEAIATWRAGLELFPDVDDLSRALEQVEE